MAINELRKRRRQILDTHRGSASLDIACHNLGFDLVTCEIDKDYFNDGNKRLKQHQKSTKNVLTMKKSNNRKSIRWKYRAKYKIC